MIYFESDNQSVNTASKIAIGDINTNIAPYATTILSRPYNTDIDVLNADAPVLNAGLDYPTPWTRDAAINTWNGVGLFAPEITKNTLLSALEKKDSQIILRDEYDTQYWDAMIWSVGAWSQFLYTGDKQFLQIAFDVIKHALEFFEDTEFDEQINLFRGPASTSDGVSGYPDVYAKTKRYGMHGGAFVLDWLDANPDKKINKGRGMPMLALSTNCIYYKAYCILTEMAKALDKDIDASWQRKADKLKQSINNNFWSDRFGYYRYLVDDLGASDRQECLGHAYALLFGVADKNKAKSVIEKQIVLPTGVPVVWPMFDRHKDGTGNSFGRHCGCIWPPFEAMFALAAKKYGNNELFLKQIDNLSKYACRDLHFAEIYHPLTGEIYGGIQQFRDNDMYLWKSCSRQTWSATGFLRLLLRGLAGMELSTDGITFNPVLSDSISKMKIRNLIYRRKKLNIEIQGPGDKIQSFKLNNKKLPESFLSSDMPQDAEIKIELSK